VNGSWLADQLARLEVRYPEIHLVFADSAASPKSGPPRPAAFLPPAPPPVARPCSPASQVLRGCLTPDGRSSRASGQSPSPRGPPRRRPATPRPSRTGHHRHRRATVGPPGSRAWRFRACTASQTAQDPPTTRANAAGDVAFHPVVRRRHPETLISRLNSPAYAYPYQRFTDALTNASA
jgi:hypothetical protein